MLPLESPSRRFEISGGTLSSARSPFMLTFTAAAADGTENSATVRGPGRGGLTRRASAVMSNRNNPCHTQCRHSHLGRHSGADIPTIAASSQPPGWWLQVMIEVPRADPTAIISGATERQHPGQTQIIIEGGDSR